MLFSWKINWLLCVSVELVRLSISRRMPRLFKSQRPQERGSAQVNIGFRNPRRLKELIQSSSSQGIDFGNSRARREYFLQLYARYRSFIWRLCVMRILEKLAMTLRWTCPAAIRAIGCLMEGNYEARNKLRTDQQEVPTSQKLASEQLWKSSRRRQVVFGTL
jgi:hypothetical protein